MNKNKMSDKDKYERRALSVYLSYLGFDYSKEEEWKEAWKKFREATKFKEAIGRVKEIEELRKKFEEPKNIKLISEEAKKRNCTISELIDYFFNHREEAKKQKSSVIAEMAELFNHRDKLVELLEEDMPEIKVSLSRIPKDIIELTNNLFTSRLSKKDYIGIEELEEYGEMEKWVSKDIGYLVKRINYLNELIGKPPKVHVSQDKNIKLLIALIEQKQYNRTVKKAEVSFTLKEYAKYRGFTEEELASPGGEIYQELRRDLFSGALTLYAVPIERNGKEYTIYGSLYQLEVPKDRGRKWTVMFNGRYAESIERILHGNEKGYFTHYLKEIADRTTNREIHLHEFYNQLVYRRRKSGTTMPTKIINILKAMKLPDKVLKRPKECYEVLKNCLIYFSSKYPEELKSIAIYNNYNKNETVKMPLGLTEAFKDYSYEDFKDLILNAIKIKDFREALISFRGDPIKVKRIDDINLEANNLINRITDWAYSNWDIKKDKTKVYSYLNMFVSKKGYDFLEQLFDKEANKLYPNAIEFLFKVLPAELKGINIENSDILL